MFWVQRHNNHKIDYTGNIALDLFTDLKSFATSEETKIYLHSWKEGIEISKTAKFIAEIL